MMSRGRNQAGGSKPNRERPLAAWRVVAIGPLPEMRLRVKFVYGGEVRLRRFLESPEVNDTVFEPLRDPPVFRQVGRDLGAVVWPTDATLAPDAMYDSIRAEGHCVVGE